MSAVDSFVQNHIAYPVLPLILLFLVLYFGRDYIMKIRKKAFAAVLTYFGEHYEKASDSVKRKLFSQLECITSKDLKLKNEGRIRILEIGIGTGMNLGYFPKSCQLIPLDFNVEIKSKLMENAKKYPHVEIEDLVVGEAENMKQIKDNSVDAVVCTLVLCSTRDSAKALEEVKRVLVPGGKFFFLEHVHAEEGTLLNKVQSLLSVTRVWPSLFLGCELNRHTWERVEKAGFSEVEFRRTDVYVPNVFIFKFVKSHIYGIATK
ncbi:hypothetical protein J437_LFUL002139 [Ladona fulva]|uniref:Methyltransferase type 11 domain-containing protein n=1 Tax=Ladona fulva TaxID=123851 RepID=A0A8K0NUI4_LADFU|nr:hypothetical protein J437_LFUL002139 [Ladona fulva]